MAPDKIYIAETPNKLIEIWSEEPIESKPYITEHEYIRKDALLEWAKKKNKMIDTEDGDYSLGYVSAMIDLIDKIEAM